MIKIKITISIGPKPCIAMPANELKIPWSPFGPSGPTSPHAVKPKTHSPKTSKFKIFSFKILSKTINCDTYVYVLCIFNTRKL